MSFLKLGATIFAVLAVAALVWASETDEIREKAKAMHREAAELAARGHGEEAANLERRVTKMLEEAERLQHHARDHHHGPDQHHDPDQHHGPDQRVAEIRKMERHDETAERLEHMRMAVEHLNHAGLHDVAEHVAARAEAAERELHEHRRHQGGDVMREIMKQLDELRHEVGRLRDDVNELREKQ